MKWSPAKAYSRQPEDGEPARGERPEAPHPVPSSPEQDPGTPSPVPDPGVPYPVPDPGVPYPVPDPGVPYPVPDPDAGSPERARRQTATRDSHRQRSLSPGRPRGIADA